MTHPQPSVYEIKKKLTGYRYPDQAANDVHVLISNFKNLKVLDPRRFVHYNGSTETLLCVGGTIPVKVRGNSYNIPIAIWLRKEHPYYTPIAFITPTPEMGISPSNFVNSSGNVFLPYLDEWKQGVSDLTALTQVMCATFGDFCPVYDKRLGDPRWQQHPARTRQAPYQPGTSPVFPGQQQQPPYQGGYPSPSYPAASTQMPMPSVPYSGSYQPQVPTSGSQPHPPYPVGQQGVGSYPGMVHQHPPSTQASTVPAAAVGLAAGVAATTISAADEERHFEVARQIERQSLESAVEDKIRRQVQQVLLEAQKEMDSLLKTQNQLKQGSLKINQMLQDMENKQREVDEGVEDLRIKNVELQSMVDHLKTQPEVNVDDAVKATTPLYDQILQLYAEENAVDDTIYHLGEALRKGVIEPEVFLKHVRELSRQQFMARATIMKARSTAGLGRHGVPA